MRFVSRWYVSIFALFVVLPFSHAQTATQPNTQPSDLVTINNPVPETPEDFTDPKLHEGELKQSVAIMLEQADFHGYSRELWRVQWRRGDPIDLYIIKPRAISKPPVILYLYGFPANADKFSDDGYCRAVTSRGSAAVGFVSALTGDRYHDRPWKEWFVSDLPEALGSTTHDVQMILNFLEKRSDLNMKSVGMFGQGSGATITALAAAVDPRIGAVDLLDPWGDWPLWMQQSSVVPETERARYETQAFQTQLKPLDPLQSLPHLRPEAVRLQQTTFNAETPMSIQQAIAQAMPTGSTKVRYASVDEYRSRAADKGVILEWLNHQLKPLD